MTPDEFEKRMKEIFPKGSYDEEIAHQKADELMCDLLRSLGYGSGVEVFEKASKWYA
ncbi:hypothetical protein P4V86_19365 [Brevibacillus laterosporus]|uniref:Uncharacterized protein n=1 Tax=Brevibacillus laterosporus TaxID=1465 RepID=A0AAP3DJU9_BRELA|nr:hypothetical protein [Brevibacillus laterosporus]MCR8982653.1 hypothetical protein [Brevibacillus laterosporus]MCZ0809809.1 hypothetical protein [Brevibacillus laterosporus]MCZ0828357.1 hypothetical protein [Brevibacillus laterosporus]MCZ0852367.1 hypothetical protein [Brevibacillus laterosporus]MED2005482.1 hypothetical protein [Brevibacillus laterosporus]